MQRGMIRVKEVVFASVRENKINRLCLTRITQTVLRLTNLWPSDSGSNWNLEMLFFFHGEVKTGVPGKKPLVARREPTTNTTQIYDTVYRNRTQATLVGGESSHHCANLAAPPPPPPTPTWFSSLPLHCPVQLAYQKSDISGWSLVYQKSA